MVITLWILAIMFSLIALLLTRKFLIASLRIAEAVLWILSIFIAAVAIGMLYDGTVIVLS